MLTKPDSITLYSRTKLDRCILEGQDGPHWRLRQFTQLCVPISDKGHGVVAYADPFVDLDEGSVQRSGLSIWANLIGVSVPMAEGSGIVPEYLNQHVFSVGQDGSDRTANVNLFMTFCMTEGIAA